MTCGYFSVSATCSCAPPDRAITCGSVTFGRSGAKAAGTGEPSVYSVSVAYRATGSKPSRAKPSNAGSVRAAVISRIRSGLKLKAITLSPGRISPPLPIDVATMNSSVSPRSYACLAASGALPATCSGSPRTSIRQAASTRSQRLSRSIA